MLPVQYTMLLKRKQEALQTRQKSTERAIYALVSMRDRFDSETHSHSLLEAWVADDERLRVEIQSYEQLLAT